MTAKKSAAQIASAGRVAAVEIAVLVLVWHQWGWTGAAALVALGIVQSGIALVAYRHLGRIDRENEDREREMRRGFIETMRQVEEIRRAGGA